MSGSVLGPRRLWSVTQTAAVANERAAGITGRNPLSMSAGLTGATFHLRVTAKNNITLNSVVIYGSVEDPVSTPQFFPAAGAGLQFALAYFTANLGIFNGILCAARVPTGYNAADGAVANAFVGTTALPNHFLLEYTTSAPGAGPTITFEVWVIGVGAKIIDRV